jgi:hypothetical protein
MFGELLIFDQALSGGPIAMLTFSPIMEEE